jgi:hypothetical protein
MPDRADGIEQSLRVLGLEPDATEQAIKDAYRDLVKVWHPDRFGLDERLRTKAQEKLKEVNRAFEQLRGYRQGDFKGRRDPVRPVDSTSDVNGPRTPAPVAERANGGPTGNLLLVIVSAAMVGTIATVLLMSGGRAAQQAPSHDLSESPAATGAARPLTSRQPTRRGVEPQPSGSLDDSRESVVAARTGSLSVTSRPMGARVSIDGRLVGETPILVRDVTPGEHHIELTLDRDAYTRWSSPVVVTAGHEEKLLAVLTPTEGVR